MEYKSIRPSQALLDPENPRLPDGTSNDKDAVNRLLAEGYGHLLALARDLVNRGEANPTELPIVIKDGARYIVLEGNRRFAALKLINDPILADDPVHRAAFERIKKIGKQPPKSIYSAVFKDRQSADHWITLRHTGANDGVGVRGWSAEQNARHRSRMKAPIDSGTLRSIAFADELTEAYQADLDLVDRINRVRSDKLTNIGRFFSGVMLTRMQFQMRQVGEDRAQSLWARHTADDLHAFFTWAFEFLDTHSVDAFKNDLVRGTLLNNNASVIPDAAHSLPTHLRLADSPYPASNAGGSAKGDDRGSEGIAAGVTRVGATSTPTGPAAPSPAPAPTTPSSGTGQGRQRDQKPERALYSQVRLPNLSANVQRLLKEAKSLPIDENYAMACVMARVILELTVSDPKVRKWSGKKENDTLGQKILGCILAIDPLIESPSKRSRQDLVQAHLETSGIGVIYLHQFMHNPQAKADPQLARRFSAAFTPLLNSIDEALK